MTRLSSKRQVLLVTRCPPSTRAVGEEGWGGCSGESSPYEEMEPVDEKGVCRRSWAEECFPDQRYLLLSEWPGS